LQFIFYRMVWRLLIMVFVEVYLSSVQK
jgi:hypothetical protein